MTYFYRITGWKDGSEKIETEEATLKLALKKANAMIAGKYGTSVDSVDICEFNEEWELHSKITFTLWRGEWSKDYQYIGEDD